MTYHNEDHEAFEREQRATRLRDQQNHYCGTLLDAICQRIDTMIPGASVEHIQWNAREQERLIRVVCPDNIVLYVDISAPSVHA